MLRKKTKDQYSSSIDHMIAWGLWRKSSSSPNIPFVFDNDKKHQFVPELPLTSLREAVVPWQLY